MTRVAVIGYASMDYPAVIDGRFEGDKTVLIRQRPIASFPRPGGCALYVAAPIAESGAGASLVTWVGADKQGRDFRAFVEDRQINAAGVNTIDAGATPICFLIYQSDGSCGCCFDPGMLGAEVLSAEQKREIEVADIFCVTVGPAAIASKALKLLKPAAKVAWVAKNDPISYPPALRGELGRRADYIFCNTAELEWIEQALAERERAAPLIIVTDGARPAQVRANGRVFEIPVQKLTFSDPCGAGDTLAGGALAAIAAGVADPAAIGAAGVNAASRLLSSRT